ncbi:MAG: hypothetical protein MZU79_07040 [Anaerotruncus sp.]|nr:hypothetical protein [Anaerotruncus sp.]
MVRSVQVRALGPYQDGPPAQAQPIQKGEQDDILDVEEQDDDVRAKRFDLFPVEREAERDFPEIELQGMGVPLLERVRADDELAYPGGP